MGIDFFITVDGSIGSASVLDDLALGIDELVHRSIGAWDTMVLGACVAVWSS
jgi:hypothetical protein